MQGLIIGGGIGGLATALALNQVGLESQIFEAAPEMKAVGAGLWLAPNGLNVLKRIEPTLVTALLAHGFALQQIDLMDHHAKLLSRLDCESVRQQHGFAPICIRRSDLQRLLCTGLSPGQLQTGKKLLQIVDEPDSVTAVFEDGTRASGDFLVGADGIHSQVRRHLLGTTPWRYSGQTCWRGLCEYTLPAPWRQGASEIWGDQAGLRAGFSQANDTQSYYYLTESQPPGEHDAHEQIKSLLLQKFQHFPQVVQQLIEATEASAILRNDLYDFKPISAYYKGRVVLIGDAAHATTPNLGQGANQALESAFVLSQCLAEANQNGNLQQAYQRYQHIRQTKARWIVETSYKMAQMTNFKAPWLQKIRNFAVAYTPTSVTRKQFERIYRLDF